MEKYNTIYKIAEERRTAKQYDTTKDIPREDMNKIYSFAKTAPHSMGLELLRVINISRDSKYKNEVVSHMMGFNAERSMMASDIALIITKKASYLSEDNAELRERVIRNTKFSTNARGEEYVEGSEEGLFNYVISADHGNNGKNNEEWMARQAYIPFGYMLLAAKSLGIDSTPVEGFMPSLDKYLQEQGLIKEDERVTLSVYFGYVTEEVKHAFIGDKQLRVSDDDYVKFE